MTARRVHVTRWGSWELVTAEPDPRLAGVVRSYTGYVGSEHVLRSREAASTNVPLLVELDSSFRLAWGTELDGATEHTGFLAGLTDSYVLTESTGTPRGVEAYLTPIGAHLLLGVPMHELANRAVGVDDILGRAGRELPERLHEAPGWEARFRILDTILAARLARAAPPPPDVTWAWDRLEETGGSVPVGALADELGWSPRRLIARFREHVGLPPKTVARIIRFERALRLLDGAHEVRWAELAFRAGYYDQPHLIRDFRAFAGLTPRELLGERPVAAA
jgi:AraC-like DNA-binding protein